MQNKNFKNTLLFPQTNFPMKANLPETEIIWQKKWLDYSIFQQRLSLNKNNKEWILHDGPPYANGNIHIGHAVNKILKDFIIRTKNFQGYHAEFIAGWDCHGLPIEISFQKQQKSINLTPIEIRENCYKFATSQIKQQLTQFQRLGLFTNWSKYYTTYSQEYVIQQLNIFAELLKSDLIYQQLKPVYWSWSSKTALAETEIIYQNKESDTVYLTMDIISNNDNLINSKFIVWTTTPYTLEANLALAVNKDLEYSLIYIHNKKYLISTSSIKRILKIFNSNEYKLLKLFSGQELVGIKYFHKLINFTGSVILGDFVNDEDGTGVVHSAPGFGLEDYYACVEHNIEPYCEIDHDGKFTSKAKISEIKNLFYVEANKIILDLLAKHKQLIHADKFIHSTAHDWRTNKPVIYRATKQWFINLQSVQSIAAELIENIETFPTWGKQKIYNFISLRKEWCLSRQRLWGVPIPIFFNHNKEPLLDNEQINHTIKLLSQHGINSWYTKTSDFFLLPKYQNQDYSFGHDIMDVWFDSGCSWHLIQHKNNFKVADLYLEGVDQFRGWFNSSLIIASMLHQKAPYKSLITHGFILDKNKNKMSKSKGNVIDPLEITSKYGADILRLWISQTNYFEDISISDDSIENAISFYRKIRNTLFRFSLGVLKDFKQPIKITQEINKYILYLLKDLIKESLINLDQFFFFKVIQKINIFLNIYSNWYLEIIKDSLYCDDINSSNRLEHQTVIYYVLHKLLLLLAPIIPHTTEEVYQFLHLKKSFESIHLLSWDQLNNLEEYFIEVNQWKEFFKLKDKIYESIETAKQKGVLKQINQANIFLSNKIKTKINFHHLLKYLGITQITWNDNDEIKVQRTEYFSCNRCRQYLAELQNNEVCCRRCNDVLKNINY